MRSLPIHGRGSSSNPANRFTELRVERDDWSHPDDPGPETRLFRDSSRSIVTTNDSPDVGFDASVNPYRGCEHGCSYCMSGDTPILLGDGSLRALEDLRIGDEIYGTARRGHYRRYVRTRVLDHWKTRKLAYRITLGDGTRIVASGDHRFLTLRGWKHVTGAQQGTLRRPHLTLNDSMLGFGSTGHPPESGSDSEDFRRGYLCGMVRGDGLLATYAYDRPNGGGGSKLLTVRLRGGLKEQLRFFHTVTPSSDRKLDIEGRALKSKADLSVQSIEHIGEMPLFDITTGTGDFIANGVVSHNCYARPNHEYLGLSAGLDFETKIFVKEDAPELLQRELASPSWEPKVLVMSGVTDPYQPAERRMEVTRGCLEVLAEARNPVSIITKSHLVTRDIDLLAELAAHDAARVTLSVTTLRNEIHRAMEPRASIPTRRLRAIRELADAGIPVGVNVAPVVPGLTDHEMGDILEAAAEAGASRAGYIVLRLPFGVKDLFVDWLEHHFPDRRGKIVHRLESLRGGRLNDPRFGSRMKGEGPYADQIRDLFRVTSRKLGLDREDGALSTSAFRRPRMDGEQIELF